MEESGEAVKPLEMKLPRNVCLMVRAVMRGAEYRSAKTPFEKAEILENSENEISVFYSCLCVGISTEIYYECKKLVLTGEYEPDKAPPNQLLKEEDGNVFF